MSQDDAARLSRSGETHFLGKCDAAIEVPMPEDMKADLTAVAALMEPKTSPARRLLSDFLYGRKAQVQRIVTR